MLYNIGRRTDEARRCRGLVRLALEAREDRSDQIRSCIGPQGARTGPVSPSGWQPALTRRRWSTTVIVATGATPRRPVIPGVDQGHVVLAVDIVEGRTTAGRTVALIVEDDGPAPPAIAHDLAHPGHDVTVVHQTAASAPDVGKHSIGSMPAQLDDAGVTLQPLTAVRAVDGDHLDVAHSYSGRRQRPGPFDTVALACGSAPRSTLVDELRDHVDDVRVIGDVDAPRRTVFATRQAWATMLELN